jgi:hypothetical protein
MLQVRTRFKVKDRNVSKASKDVISNFCLRVGSLPVDWFSPRTQTAKKGLKTDNNGRHKECIECFKGTWNFEKEKWNESGSEQQKVVNLEVDWFQLKSDRIIGGSWIDESAVDELVVVDRPKSSFAEASRSRAQDSLDNRKLHRLHFQIRLADAEKPSWKGRSSSTSSIKLERKWNGDRQWRVCGVLGIESVPLPASSVWERKPKVQIKSFVFRRLARSGEREREREWEWVGGDRALK